MSSKTFTEDEKKDICKSYRLAKDPAKQIKTLAELNACYKSDIECVLQESGLIPKKEYVTSLPDLKNFKPVVPIGNVLEKKPKSKHNWEDWEIKDLVLLKAKGVRNRDLADHFGVSLSSINSQVFLHRAEINAKELELKFSNSQEKEESDLTASDAVEAASDIELSEDTSEIANCETESDDEISDEMISEVVDVVDTLYIPTNDIIEFLEDFKSQFSGPLKLDSNSDLYYFGIKMGMLTTKADELLRRLKSIGK